MKLLFIFTDGGKSVLFFVFKWRRDEGADLPRTMASIWVAFFSLCWEIFLLLMVFREVWVLPLRRATRGAGFPWASLAGSPFFSVLWPSSGGVGGVDVGLALALVDIRSWWLVAGVSPRAHCGCGCCCCCCCLWLPLQQFSSSSSRPSPSFRPSLINICDHCKFNYS